MKNQEISKIFYEFADMLELKNENPFKINSFRKAARVIENLTDNIEDIYKEGKLQEIPGIGKGIAERIESFITKGVIPDYDELKKEIPQGLLECLAISEIGPKTVQLLYNELKITNIEQLEKAVREHKIKDLFRMGEKTEENILKGIELYKRKKERVLLGTALPFAEKIVNELKKLKEVKKINFAGSLRRYKETIGDVDILITSKNSEKVMEKFVNLSIVKEILAKGPTKSSILSNIDLQVDLRVVDEESFGAALQYFTGSKEHNIALREMAIKKNLKINEYGVFDTKGKKEKKIAGKDEKEVYGTLGLPVIPPEIRENLGEIECALSHKLPDLINFEDIKGDLQIHSKFSDGSDSIEELVEYAKLKGYKYIAISDHSKSLKVAGGLSEQRLKEQINLIKELNKKLKNFRIISSIEVEIKSDGSLDFDDEILKELDIVSAAVHSGFKQPKEAMTERIIKAMKNKNVDIIVHPTGRLINERPPYEVDIEKILSVAAETNTALEINAFPERLDLKDIYCRKAKEYGVKITISTDAHKKTQMDFIRYGVATARRGWLEKIDVLNTLEPEELLSLFSKK